MLRRTSSILYTVLDALGASVTEARAFMVSSMVSVMRRRVSFAAAMAHARLRLSRLERICHAGRIAGRGSDVVAPFLSQTVWEQHAPVQEFGDNQSPLFISGLFTPDRAFQGL